MKKYNYKKDYPLFDEHPEVIKAYSGKKINDINMDNLLKGELSSDDARIHKDILLIQSEIANSAGQTQVAQNLKRAAELTVVPDDLILHIYDLIRPYHGSYDEIVEAASILRNKYDATINSEFLLEAASILKDRKKLKGDR